MYSYDEYRTLEESRNKLAQHVRVLGDRNHDLKIIIALKNASLEKSISRGVEKEKLRLSDELEEEKVRAAAWKAKWLELYEHTTMLEREWRASHQHNVLLREEVLRLDGTIPRPPLPYEAPPRHLPPNQNDMFRLWEDDRRAGNGRVGEREKVCAEVAEIAERAKKRKTGLL